MDAQNQLTFYNATIIPNCIRNILELAMQDKDHVLFFYYFCF